jgi:gelsolin
VVKDGENISTADLDGKDVFLFDTGKVIWVWEGNSASHKEKAAWIKVAQSYVRRLQSEAEHDDNYLIPVAKVNEGNESPAFLRSFE